MGIKYFNELKTHITKRILNNQQELLHPNWDGADRVAEETYLLGIHNWKVVVQNSLWEHGDR